MRNRKPTKDTYYSTAAAVARRVLASPLAACIGYPDVPEEKNQDLFVLKGVASGARRYEGMDMLSFSLRRADTNVTLSIEGEPRSYTKFEADEAGNEYTEHELRVTLNWPCHGASDVATSVGRLAFYQDVAKLAAEIHAEFCGNTYWRLYQTKEEKEAYEERLRRSAIERGAEKAIDSVRAGMRANTPPKPVAAELVKDIPDGAYEHTFNDGKKFMLRVEQGVGLVGRIG